MEQDIELEVWRLAQQTCDTMVFVGLIEKAIDGFKRNPGYDPLLRLHISWIGEQGIRVLRDVMTRRDLYSGQSASYVELRSRLKNHLRNQLQCHLVAVGQATDNMQDDQLGRDLGL